MIPEDDNTTEPTIPDANQALLFTDEIPGQDPLFEIPPAWADTWHGMPEFEQHNAKPADTINVQFRTEEDRRQFLTMLGENPARRKSIWYPKMDYLNQSSRNHAPVTVEPNRYPVYIISKGRWDKRLTSKALDKLGIPYHIVVEPQEYEQYAATIDPDKILVLPFSNLGQGSIPARNFVWEHATTAGASRHWILDDNIDGFYRLNRNLKTKVVDFNPFTQIEDFTDRYQNIGISGMNYEFFADRRSEQPPYYLNTRVYSCILIRNDLPYRWRGRYNEDTDLCLRALKDGWVTVLFNSVLAKKMPTMTMEGGNTDELYQGDGRLRMAQALQEQHPDVVTVTTKWGRPQHHVNYRIFRHNTLIPISHNGGPHPEDEDINFTTDEDIDFTADSPAETTQTLEQWLNTNDPAAWANGHHIKLKACPGCDSPVVWNTSGYPCPWCGHQL